MNPIKIVLHESVLGIVQCGFLRLSGITLPKDDGDDLWRAVQDECAALKEQFEGTPVSEVPGIQDARTLYRSVKIDPTKHRPSSEALLRRTLKGRALYRVHPLVDTFNLASLKSLLPVGLYDVSKIRGDTVTIRLGSEDWTYEGIRRGPINVAGRLCVADQHGPFGSPTADSARTAIEGDVPNALAIFFQTAKVDTSRLELAFKIAAEISTNFLNANIETTQLLF